MRARFRRAGGEGQERIGRRRVAVDGDSVERSATPSLSSARSAGALIGASVKTNDKHGRHVGPIMPAPLAMPLMVTSASPMWSSAVATFGKVSVVMIAWPRPATRRRGASQPVDPSRRRTCGVERLADHAGRSEEHRAGRLQPTAFARSPGGEGRGRGRLPVKALALPEFTTSARALPAGVRAAPFDRRGRTFRLGEHAGRRGAVHHREQHVGAVP